MAVRTFFSSRSTLTLIIILLVAIFLRFWKLGAIPNGLNRDEASLGYTAYSILKTGADEYGKYLPINIQSFGDWKLPLYIYLSIPIVQVFGLTPFSIRLLSALSGVVIVGLSYVLTNFLVKKWKAPKWLPLLPAGFMAILPWTVHLSRVAYEANVALMFCMLGMVLWFYAFEFQKKWLLVVASLSLGLTLIGYHAFQIFTPLLLLWTAWIWKNEVSHMWKKEKHILIVSAIVFFIPIFLLFADKAVQSNQTKYAGISIFSTRLYAQDKAQLTEVLAAHGFGFLRPIYSSRPVLIGQKIILNIMSMLDPNFLFIRGGNHGSHNVPRLSNLFAFNIITLAVGLFLIFRGKKTWQVWIVGWIMIAAIAPLLTIEANHSVRFFPAVFGLGLVCAYGFGKLWYKHLILKLILVFVTSLSVIHLSITYFIIFPSFYPDRWPWYMSEIVEVVDENKSQYASVLMQGESSSPYIYFLFNNPDRVIRDKEELVFYPPTDEGFTHVQKLGKIHFGTIDWMAIEAQTEPVLLVAKPSEIPGDKLNNSHYSIVRRIEHARSEISYLILEYK